MNVRFCFSTLKYVGFQDKVVQETSLKWKKKKKKKTFKIGNGICQDYTLSPCLFNYMQSTSYEMLGCMITNWNQDCWEKYQQLQICRWYHSNGRKGRTKEPLDESERGEWKSWLKSQHSKNKDHGLRSHHFMANRPGKSESS